MRGNQKNKTSVFSEYENNQNDSISSRQLEYWLKQTAPSAQPKFAGIQWTLMSTNSIFEQEEHTLQRNETFESLPNKENDHLAFNSAKPTLSNNSSGMMKSKSYVNAMVDLQSRVRHLQQENNCLKNSVNTLRDERNRALNESTHNTEQLRQRIDILQPKARKIDQLVRDNKMLRDWREQNSKKSKLLQKINKDSQSKLSQYQDKLQKCTQELRRREELHKEFKITHENQMKEHERLKDSLLKLQERNKTLEDMKQKSTTSIIEKYNKTVDMVENLTTQNMRLKQDLQLHKQKHEDKLKYLEQSKNQQKTEIKSQFEVMKQELFEKRQKLGSMTQELTYFKQKYEKTNEELITTLKRHANEIKDIKELHSREISKEREKMEKELKKQRENSRKWFEREREKRQKEIILREVAEERDVKNIEDESRIQTKENPKILIESHLQFGETRSLDHEVIDERDFHDTRSQQKEQIPVSILKDTKMKPLDTLSQQNQKINRFINYKPSIDSKSNKTNKSRRLSQEKQFSHSRQKSKSRSKSRQVERPVQYEQDRSFIVKSCEPVTQYQNTEHFLYSEEPHYYNSANNVRNNGQYYYEPNDIAEFGLSQKPNSAASARYDLEQAMLIEINKQTIRLIEEQEKCMMIINEDVNSNKRAENFGRMKQISEQIKVNNNKMIELKQKMSSS